MEIKLNITGVDEVAVELRNTAEKLHSHSARELTRLGDRIVKRARNYAPEDKGNLVASIRAEKTKDERGRVQIDILAGGEVNGVNVDQYLLPVHENYEDMLYGPYGKGPSDKTKIKMAKFPGKVGSKFIDTAVKDEMPSVWERLTGYIKQFMDRKL